jgi:hypothetical protein
MLFGSVRMSNFSVLGSSVGEEQRQSIRKILRTKAVLRIDGAEPIASRTMDIGSSGLGISCQQQLVAGQAGHIAFELFINGRSYVVGSRVKVTYCIYSSSDGFKVGLQFINLDMAGASAITKFMI